MDFCIRRSQKECNLLFIFIDLSSLMRLIKEFVLYTIVSINLTTAAKYFWQRQTPLTKLKDSSHPQLTIIKDHVTTRQQTIEKEITILQFTNNSCNKILIK